MTPDNLLGDYKKLPKEMNKHIVKPVAKYIPGTSSRSSKRGQSTGNKSEKSKSVKDSSFSTFLPKENDTKIEEDNKIPEYI